MHAAVEEAWVIWDALAVANVRPQAAKVKFNTRSAIALENLSQKVEHVAVKLEERL